MEKYELIKDIVVMYVPALSFPDGIQQAFDDLKDKLPPGSGRVFFGISQPDENGKIVYQAAAEEKYKGEGKNYGLNIFTVSKGTYISELIQNFNKDIKLIGKTFQQLLQHPQVDKEAYCLEWYKGNDVLCLVRIQPVND